jgi:hypothetical protein
VSAYTPPPVTPWYSNMIEYKISGDATPAQIDAIDGAIEQASLASGQWYRYAGPNRLSAGSGHARHRTRITGR